MSISKIFLVAAIFTAFILMNINVSVGVTGDSRVDVTPYLSKAFSIQVPGKLKVRTSGGAIKVVGTGDNQVRVEMFVSKHGENLSPSDTKLKHFDIKIEKEGNTVIASAKHRNSSWWKFWKRHNISISFVVYTPHKMSADLQTSGGHIITTGLTGNLDIRTSGGYLKLGNLEGNIQARTSGGHIELSNSSGNISIRTSGGRIEISNVSGKLNAKTSGGGIRANDIEGQIHLHTSGGSIRIKKAAGSLSASTSGGSITAQLTQIKQFVKLRTSGGNIHIIIPKNIGLNLDLHGSDVHTRLSNFSGSIKPNDVEGTINGGGPEITAHTSGGSVDISYQ